MMHRHLTLLKITTISIFSLSFLFNYTIGWRDKQILSPAFGHTGRRTVSTAWWDCSRKAFVFGNYFADGTQSGYPGKITSRHKNSCTWRFIGNMMNRDRFCHILRFMHFYDNTKDPNKTPQLWPTVETRNYISLIYMLHIRAQLNI